MRHALFHRFARHNRGLGRAGTAAIAALAASAWIAPALAQPMPSGPMGGPMGGPPGQTQEGNPMPGMMGHPGMHPGMHHGMHHGGMRGPFGGLVYPREDKQLTAPEVQRIAEAMLLWQGERSWKIAQLREAANNTVEFAVTTAEGSVVARFSVDRKTGRPRRIG